MSDLNILPIDTTFLSCLLYEGYLRYLKHNSLLYSFNEVSSRILDLKTVSKIHKFNLAANDYMRSTSPIQVLLGSKITDLFDNSAIDKIKDLCENTEISELSLKINMKRKEMHIGKDPVYTAIQIFKSDRYTGFTSFENKYILGQYKLKLSVDTFLLGLVGIYSSYVTRNIRINRQDEYYFIFFSPHEEINLLNNRSLISSYFSIKDAVIEELRDMLLSKINEAWLLELYINMSISKMLEEYNIGKMSLLIFDIVREGGQTYKIYEIIPIEIYSSPHYISLLRRYITNTDRFLFLLNTSLKRIIWRLSNPNSEEWSNLLNAVRGLYSFIVFGNPTGFYMFSKELYNAYEKIKDKNKKYAEIYLTLLSSLPSL